MGQACQPHHSKVCPVNSAALEAARLCTAGRGLADDALYSIRSRQHLIERQCIQESQLLPTAALLSSTRCLTHHRSRLSPPACSQGCYTASPALCSRSNARQRSLKLLEQRYDTREVFPTLHIHSQIANLPRISIRNQCVQPDPSDLASNNPNHDAPTREIDRLHPRQGLLSSIPTV